LLGNFVNDNFYKKYGENFSSPLPEEIFKQPIYPVPLVWVDIKNKFGSERREGTSRVRECEVKYIVNKLKEYLNNPQYKNLTFGVISFYSGQVKAIRKALGELKNKVRVGSVDAFQGMEFDVIFLSVVRSYDVSHFKNVDMQKLNTDISKLSPSDEEYIEYQKFLEYLKISNYGFLTSENRLCVALSRQKKLLIVVGNSDIFTGEVAGKVAERCVPAMKNLYDLCLEKGIHEEIQKTMNL
jgi:superfamily I DNA and/or RNA helicase